MSTPFRCADSSERRGESLVGTASTIRAFLLVECPGPWGVHAIIDNRLPQDVTRELRQRAHAAGVRVLLIRRHGRNPLAQMTVFAAFADVRDSWVETSCLDRPEELLDIDLEGLGAGRSPGLSAHDAPLFLVCTHGRHDVCCAERGRPVARALAAQFPDETWEVSHIGGDRFAGNVLVLPDGLYYGRVRPEEAVDLAETHHAGRLDLAHLRGRSTYPFAVQVAEVHLRKQLGDTRLTSLRLTGRRKQGETTTAMFTDGDRSWRVVVRTESTAAEQLTCRAARLGVGPLHEVIAVTPEPPIG